MADAPCNPKHASKDRVIVRENLSFSCKLSCKNLNDYSSKVIVGVSKAVVLVALAVYEKKKSCKHFVGIVQNCAFMQNLWENFSEF